MRPNEIMFSSLVSSVRLFREKQEDISRAPSIPSPWPDPTRFIRKKSRQTETELVTEPQRAATETPSDLLEEANTLLADLAYDSSPSWSDMYHALQSQTYRNKALLPGDGNDGIVTPRAASSRINEDVDSLVEVGWGGALTEHDVKVSSPEDLLQAVESQTRELGLNEVGPVLHDRLELDMPVPALPPGDQMQHVGALRSLPVLFALAAGQGDAQRGEHGLVGNPVPHPEEAGEEVDLTGDCGDGQEAGCPYDEEGEDGLVDKVNVNVRRLLQDDDVSSCVCI